MTQIRRSLCRTVHYEKFIEDNKFARVLSLLCLLLSPTRQNANLCVLKEDVLTGNPKVSKQSSEENVNEICQCEMPVLGQYK